MERRGGKHEGASDVPATAAPKRVYRDYCGARSAQCERSRASAAGRLRLGSHGEATGASALGMQWHTSLASSRRPSQCPWVLEMGTSMAC